MFSNLRSLSIAVFISLAAACGGEAELQVPADTAQQNPTAAAPKKEDAVAAPTGSESNAPYAPVMEPPSMQPPVAPPAADEPPAAPPAAEPPAAGAPATEPPAAPPAAEPPPAAPAATPPPAEPPATPTPPPAADPNAGWTSIPQGTTRATFSAGQTGPGTTGAAFIMGINGSRKYRMRYEVMPEGNFDFRAGGKLPGFGGGSTPAGGSDATNGYSGRLMWNTGGRLSFYFYRVTGGTGGLDTGGYGTHWMWADDAKLKAGQWNTIEIVIDMDSGETVGYLNGVEKARQTLSYQWNTTDKIVFSAFFGGQGAAYEPSKNEAMSFRNMVIKPSL